VPPPLWVRTITRGINEYHGNIYEMCAQIRRGGCAVIRCVASWLALARLLLLSQHRIPSLLGRVGVQPMKCNLKGASMASSAVNLRFEFA